MTCRHKACTLYFYKLNVGESKNLPQIEEELHDFFETYSGKPDPTPNILIVDNRIQLQDIVECKQMESVVSGVVKKFIDIDIPKKGVVGKVSETEFELKKNESLIEKTYFLYDLSNHVLLYQSNRHGTSYNHFTKYLNAHLETSPKIGFNFIPTFQSYDMFLQGNAKLKKVNIRIPRPTAASLLKSTKNPWMKSLLDIITGVGGDLNFTLNTEAKHDNRSLNKHGIHEFLKSFREMTSETTDIKGKIEVIGEDDTIHPIDLVMDKLSATVNIPMDGRYLRAEDIIAEMERAFEKKQDVLNKIFGGGGGK